MNEGFIVSSHFFIRDPAVQHELIDCPRTGIWTLYRMTLLFTLSCL